MTTPPRRRPLQVAQWSMAGLLLATAVSQSDARQTNTKIPGDQEAAEWAVTALVRGSKSELANKRVGPIRVIFTDETGKARELIADAVGELNDAFGYGKLALSESEKAVPEDDAIVLYIGSKAAGRRLVEDFGISSPQAFRSGSYYCWMDSMSDRRISRAIVALDGQAGAAEMKRDLQRYLLGCLGYSGASMTDGDFLVMHALVRTKFREPKTLKLLSEMDAAMLKFCDNHVPPGVKAWEIRKIVEQEWPDFSAAYWNPSMEKTAAVKTTN